MICSGINCGFFCIHQLDLCWWRLWPLWLLRQATLWLRLCPTHTQLGEIPSHFVFSHPNFWFLGGVAHHACLPVLHNVLCSLLYCQERLAGSPGLKTSSMTEQHSCCYKIKSAFDWCPWSSWHLYLVRSKGALSVHNLSLQTGWMQLMILTRNMNKPINHKAQLHIWDALLPCSYSCYTLLFELNIQYMLEPK